MAPDPNHRTNISPTGSERRFRPLEWQDRPFHRDRTAAETLAAGPLEGSENAGAEAGEDVAAVGREEVAIGRARDAGARCPAAAAQDLARSEPGLRVVLVGIGGEAGERQEIRRRPFPDIADHLAAAEGAVAGRQRGDID